jgi:hypothetical protein
MCVLGSECAASAIAFWIETSASARAVLNPRRNEWKSTGIVVAVSK